MFKTLYGFARSWPAQFACAVVGAIGVSGFIPAVAPAVGGAFLVGLAVLWSLPQPGVSRLFREFRKLASTRHYLITYGLGLLLGAAFAAAFLTLPPHA